MSTLFVTGLSGTIGRHLAKNGVVPLQFRDLSSCLSEIRRCSERFSVLHLAGIVGAAPVESDPKTSFQVNVENVGLLAAECLDNPKFLGFTFVSSSHVYAPSDLPLSESSPLGPTTEYGRQKLLGEEMLGRMFSCRPEQLLIARLFSILDLWGSKDFTLGGAIRKIAQGNKQKLKFSDDVRDFMSPKQAADLLLEVTQEDKASGTLNIATGNGISIRQATQEVLRANNLVIPDGIFEPGNSEVPKIVADVGRFIELAGHKPGKFIPNI